MKLNTDFDIRRAVNRAKTKHPMFAENIYQAISLASEELGEMAQAVNDGDMKKARKEALDLIAVCVRFLEWEK